MVFSWEGRAISRLPTEYNGGTCRKLTENYMEITRIYYRASGGSGKF